MRKFSFFTSNRSFRKRKVDVQAGSAPNLQGREKDDARALELMRIFSDAEPIAYQGKLERRTVR